MSSLSDVEALLVAKVLSDLSPTRALAQPLARREALASGETVVMALSVVAGYDRRDSNVPLEVGQVRLWILHRLADSADEAAYLTDDLPQDQAALMGRDFWEVAGVVEVIDVPTMEVRPQRLGRVVEYAIDCQVSYPIA